MKKLFALCLVLLLVLCGCAETPAEPAVTTEPIETTDAPATPAGTLYISFGTVLELVYDDAGNALTLTGTDEAGKALAAAKQDQLNKACVYTLRSVLRSAISDGLLDDVKVVTFRIGVDDPLPTEEFLNVIWQDCQYLIDEELLGVGLHCLTGELLDEKGDLTYEAARKLAGKHLGAEVDQVTGDQTPADGVYTFTGAGSSCTIDVFTGLVTAIH